MSKSTFDLLLNYQDGHPYRKLHLNEFVGVSPHEIIRMANEYGVKFEDFHTNEDEWKRYVWKLVETSSFYMREVEEKRAGGTNMILNFCGLPSLLITIIFLLVFPSFLLLAPLIFILLMWLVGETIYPYFEKWYNNRLEQKFAEKHLEKRNKNVENFINEVMFQAYIRNRNIRIEYGYSLI